MYYEKLANEDENRRIGLVLSIGLHLLLLLLGIFITWSHMDPPPEAPGIMINIGFVDSGSNDDLPDQQNEKEVEKSAPATKPAPQKPTEPKKEEPAKKVESKPVPAKVKSKIAIDEESAVIAAAKEDQKNKEETLKKQQQEEANKKQEAAAEKQRQLDAAEQQRKNEEAAEAKKYQESKKKFGDLFGKGKGSGANNGDQGDPNGKPNADALDGISKGSGKIGGGLSDRGVAYEPIISDNSQKIGKVVVKICVDADGNVISAKYTQKGSTTTDQTLINIAENGSKKYKFTGNGAERQCGTVTIDFKLQ